MIQLFKMVPSQGEGFSRLTARELIVRELESFTPDFHKHAPCATLLVS